MSKVVAICHSWWCCTPRLVQWLAAVFLFNAVSDFLLFPIVHSAWNLIGFEGWFLDK